MSRRGGVSPTALSKFSIPLISNKSREGRPLPYGRHHITIHKEAPMNVWHDIDPAEITPTEFTAVIEIP